jgi:hypothetical protein
MPVRAKLSVSKGKKLPETRGKDGCELNIEVDYPWVERIRGSTFLAFLRLNKLICHKSEICLQICLLQISELCCR